LKNITTETISIIFILMVNFFLIFPTRHWYYSLNIDDYDLLYTILSIIRLSHSFMCRWKLNNKKVQLMKKLIAAFFATVMLSATAQAATTTFDFLSGSNGNIGWTTGNLNYTSNGLSMSASSARYSNGGVYDSGYIRQYNGHGLTVYNGQNDAHYIDGRGYNDVVYFDFGTQEVQLKSVTFKYFDGGDRFALFADSDNDGSLELINGSLNANPSDTYTFLTPYLFSGTEFGIGALGYYDDFKIASMTVEAISTVPLPAALPLYAAGVALLGFVGCRRKKSA